MTDRPFPSFGLKMSFKLITPPATLDVPILRLWATAIYNIRAYRLTASSIGFKFAYESSGNSPVAFDTSCSISTGSYHDLHVSGSLLGSKTFIVAI
jgi:hypothetical protein